MLQSEPADKKTVSLARYHFRTAMYLNWLSNLMPRDSDGWRPPRPLWAHPSGAPRYLHNLESETLANDQIRRRNGLPSLVAVCSLDRLNESDASPQALDALVVLYTDAAGAVVEARLSTDDAPDCPPVAVPFPADFGCLSESDGLVFRILNEKRIARFNRPAILNRQRGAAKLAVCAAGRRRVN